MKEHINWIKVSEQTLPKPEITTEGSVTTQTISVEIICYDGDAVFEQYYSFDRESDREWMLKYVTHYIKVKNLPKPIES